MSRKKLLIVAGVIILLVNVSIFGTLALVEMMRGPTAEEIAAQKEAERQAVIDAIYAEFEPIEFKSKANHIAHIGEAIGLCSEKLDSAVKEIFSWQTNMIESRFKPEIDMYLVVMEYQTLARKDKPSTAYEVTCEVNAEKRVVELWKVSEAEE